MDKKIQQWIGRQRDGQKEQEMDEKSDVQYNLEMDKRQRAGQNIRKINRMRDGQKERQKERKRERRRDTEIMKFAICIMRLGYVWEDRYMDRNNRWIENTDMDVNTWR